MWELTQAPKKDVSLLNMSSAQKNSHSHISTETPRVMNPTAERFEMRDSSQEKKKNKKTERSPYRRKGIEKIQFSSYYFNNKANLNW